MNILIISRCTKRARKISCQIIDQFAERTGDAAWQTAITLDGVNTLRKLLRKHARRNTAVQDNGVLKDAGRFVRHEITLADGVEPWFAVDYQKILLGLADVKQMELKDVSRRYGEVTVRAGEEDAIAQWRYHPLLGVFRDYY